MVLWFGDWARLDGFARYFAALAARGHRRDADDTHPSSKLIELPQALAAAATSGSISRALFFEVCDSWRTT